MNVDGNELVAIMNREGVSNKFRSNGGRTGPRFDDFLLVRFVEGRDLLLQANADERTLLQ
jgi:hypothetical protein